MSVQAFGKVAVLIGGTSAEREVSLISGNAVLQALLRKGVNAVGIDTRDYSIHQLIEQQFDRVFIVLHGRGGEDGTIQGVLTHLGLPYTGSRVLASALGMDKLRTKQVWLANGLPTPAYRVLTAQSDWAQVVAELGLPLMVKPVLEGSSVGISKVTRVEDLAGAWEKAAQCQSPVIAEQFITGEEFTVAVLGETVLPPIRLETPRTFYDYEAKYSDDTETRYICPCGLPTDSEEAMKKTVLNAFQAVGAVGWGRIDLMRDAQGQIWLLEINTVPGMTSHSLVPMAAKVAGIEFDDLVLKILESAY